MRQTRLADVTILGPTPMRLVPVRTGGGRGCNGAASSDDPANDAASAIRIKANISMQIKLTSAVSSLIIVLALASGCTRLWRGVFVANTRTAVRLEIVKPSGRTLNSFDLAPGETVTKEIMFGTIIVTDSRGNELYSKKIDLTDSERKFSKPGENAVHFLVTETAIYPIPVQYRGNWRDHRNEITQGRD